MADRKEYRGGRKQSVRVVVNRNALDDFRGGVADGLGLVGQRIIDAATPNVPDAPPLGRGLVKTGGWAVYVDGKKVGGGASVRLGRRNEVKPPRKGIALYWGYDFPAHLLEGGTIRQPAQPFLTPATFEVIPDAAQIIRGAPSLRSRFGSRAPIGVRA